MDARSTLSNGSTANAVEPLILGGNGGRMEMI